VRVGSAAPLALDRVNKHLEHRGWRPFVSLGASSEKVDRLFR